MFEKNVFVMFNWKYFSNVCKSSAHAFMSKGHSLKAKFSIIFTKKVNRDVLVEWYTENRVILNGRNVLI